MNQERTSQARITDLETQLSRVSQSNSQLRRDKDEVISVELFSLSVTENIFRRSVGQNQGYTTSKIDWSSLRIRIEIWRATSNFSKPPMLMCTVIVLSVRPLGDTWKQTVRDACPLRRRTLL